MAAPRVGTRGWQFGVVIKSDGDQVFADRPAGKASSDGVAFSVELDFGADGIWRWRPPFEGVGRVSLPGPSETTPLWAGGFFQRDGDDRELVYAHTLAEVYPHHLDPTTDR